MKLGDKLAMLRDHTETPLPVRVDDTSERTQTLVSLRRKMDAILGRLNAPARAPADPAATELPFVRHETDCGILCQRLETLRPSHHVGRIPVEAAFDAETELLALLALDPSIAGIDARRVLFLDTETTGLAGSGTIAFLLGLAFFDADGRLRIEQLFLRSPGEEAPLLRRLRERITDASCLVTFNGKSFDLPLVESRFVMNRMPKPPARPHLDLVHVARRLHKRRIGACTLRAVEAQVLGFERDGDIDGGEVAPRYAHFLRTGDEAVLRAVVDHNFWDVISMAALMGLYGEPLGVLHDEDLLGLARTLQRARALGRAAEVADAAVARGCGPDALWVRGRIAKARGDRTQALEDFERLSSEIDDPSLRLELAKLYEHFVKEPQRALEYVDLGTGEAEQASARRRNRLARKVARRAGQGSVRE
jgi:uncharacterized protein YprB with RNaseH-like and TPR domain